jgi:DNA recombination protein RmuC
MNDPLMTGLLFLLVGLVLGGAAAWLYARLRFSTQYLPVRDVDERYVPRQVFEQLQQQSDLYRDDLLDKEEELRILSGRLASQEQDIRHLEDRLAYQKEEVTELQERARLEFENLAGRLLEEKSQKFTSQNQQQLQDLLTPLREQIKAFEDGIGKRFIEETRDRVSLKKEIEQLRELNVQLGLEAGNLASALKGDNKIQGDWGEVQLETLLEHSGLQRDVHYRVQSSLRDADGRQKRPDFIVQLPDDKHLVIDSKVSLLAYEQYYHAANDEERERHLHAHLDSLRRHIRDLSGKNYQQLYQINTPDYLLLFVPLEPAFALAAQRDQRLFLDALERNVVLVTTSTLLATMRTVAYIWKQEKQKRSVQEIARQSGLLYDKFCGFVDDLRAIGQRLDQTQSAYTDAMNKLVDSRKYGDTLIGRAERIRALGAPATKELPREWVDMGDQGNGEVE